MASSLCSAFLVLFLGAATRAGSRRAAGWCPRWLRASGKEEEGEEEGEKKGGEESWEAPRPSALRSAPSLSLLLFPTTTTATSAPSESPLTPSSDDIGE